MIWDYDPDATGVDRLVVPERRAQLGRQRRDYLKAMANRADACWLPIAAGLTPHGLRHTYKTLMVQLGTPSTVMDEQMGHADGSVQARYSHGTPEMWQQLLDGLTGLWNEALAARRRLSPGSPVGVLDRLLREDQEG